jgi:release factor glutamine methyltransferase
VTAIAAWLSDNADLPRLERELLVGDTLQVNRTAVIAHPERTLSGRELDLLTSRARRLRRGEPLSYITGLREFWSLSLMVSPAVLIPRPETETLVEQTLGRLTSEGRLLELGTGSGAIAIALATEGQFDITATDTCPEALRVAAGNVRRHGVAVRLAISNWFDRVDDRYNVIVSNPPYVAADDIHLAALSHEPALALVGGADGLDALRAIIRGASGHLIPEGWLLLEHGYDQGADVRRLLDEHGFTDVRTICDLSGCERVTEGRRAPCTTGRRAP